MVSVFLPKYAHEDPNNTSQRRFHECLFAPLHSNMMNKPTNKTTTNKLNTHKKLLGLRCCTHLFTTQSSMSGTGCSHMRNCMDNDTPAPAVDQSEHAHVLFKHDPSFWDDLCGEHTFKKLLPFIFGPGKQNP
jgi:hypothetical protein